MLLYSITAKLNFTELSILSFSWNKGPVSSSVTSAPCLCCDEKHLCSEVQHSCLEKLQCVHLHIVDVTYTETLLWTTIQAAASAAAADYAATWVVVHGRVSLYVVSTICIQYIEAFPNRSAWPQNRGAFHRNRGRVLRRRNWRQALISTER